LEASSSYHWDKPYVDGLNFHLYIVDPDKISEMMHEHQLKKKMLINNEGGAYYDIDKSIGSSHGKMRHSDFKLNREIRAMWGNITAGGYYLFYHGPVRLMGNPVSLEAVKAAQAARNIMETLPFWQMRPVRSDGTEYDDIVRIESTSKRQVLAQERNAYLIYFWGDRISHDLIIGEHLSIPGIQYKYKWYDTRHWGPAFKSGTSSRIIPVPHPSQWAADSGVVLTIESVFP
jgi:hypothetical protein